MAQEETNSPAHDKNIVQEHEDLFEKIHDRLGDGDKVLNWIVEEIKLMKSAWGIKNLKNGERDRKLKEIQKRTDKGLEKAEDEDKNLRELIQEQGKIISETKETLARLEGYLTGSKEVKKDSTEWTKRKKLVVLGSFSGWIFGIITLIIVAFTVL